MKTLLTVPLGTVQRAWHKYQARRLQLQMENNFRLLLECLQIPADTISMCSKIFDDPEKCHEYTEAINAMKSAAKCLDKNLPICSEEFQREANIRFSNLATGMSY